MSYIGDKDFLIEVAKGNVAGHSMIHKFGRNAAVGTSFVPVALGGVYQTPQAASATTLRIKAGGDAADAAAGAGAREVTLIGLDGDGNEVTEAVATAGASASSATTATFMRLYRAYVSASGTYATTAAGSHVADIVIENGAGGTDWATIEASDYPRSQTEIGVMSIPIGTTGYLLRADSHTDSARTTDLIFFSRESILDAAAPYEASRMQFEMSVKGGHDTMIPKTPIVITGPADCGFLAKVETSTAIVDVDFCMLLVS